MRGSNQKLTHGLLNASAPAMRRQHEQTTKTGGRKKPVSAAPSGDAFPKIRLLAGGKEKPAAPCRAGRAKVRKDRCWIPYTRLMSKAKTPLFRTAFTTT